MSKQVKITNESYQELRAVAEERGVQIGEAADFLIRVAASRRASLAKYREKTIETAPAKKPKKGAAKKAKKEGKEPKPAKGAKGSKKAKADKPKRSRKVREDVEVEASEEVEI